LMTADISRIERRHPIAFWCHVLSLIDRFIDRSA